VIPHKFKISVVVDTNAQLIFTTALGALYLVSDLFGYTIGELGM
tara:strand:+ start:655 stop:786 length:132 start_codon:yes stop_codon:yes gene_type:complete